MEPGPTDRLTPYLPIHRNSETKRNIFGTFSESSWSSDTEELTITFSPNPRIVEECGRRLVLSQQEYAVELETYNDLTRSGRRKRMTFEFEPLVKSPYVETPQLAAELTASQFAIYRNMKETFHRLALKSCELRRMEYDILLSLDPSLAARKIYKKRHLKGEWIDAQTLKITKCYPVSWVPRSTDVCYEHLPVNATLPDGSIIQAFLNLHTCIIEKASQIMPCSEHRFKSFFNEGKVYTYNVLTGKYRQPQFNVHTVGHPSNWTGLDLHPKIFHNLVLTNMSDEQSALFRSLRLFKISQHHQYTNEHFETHGEFHSPLPVPNFDWSFLSQEFVRKTFVTTVSIAVTIVFVYRFLWPKLFRNGLRRAIQREVRDERTALAAQTLASRPSFRRTQVGKRRRYRHRTGGRLTSGRGMSQSVTIDE